MIPYQWYDACVFHERLPSTVYLCNDISATQGAGRRKIQYIYVTLGLGTKIIESFIQIQNYEWGSWIIFSVILTGCIAFFARFQGHRFAHLYIYIKQILNLDELVNLCIPARKRYPPQITLVQFGETLEFTQIPMLQGIAGVILLGLLVWETWILELE